MAPNDAFSFHLMSRHGRVSYLAHHTGTRIAYIHGHTLYMHGHASKHVSINIPTPNQAAPQPNDGSRATRLDCDAAAPPSCHGKNPCPPQDAQARTQPPPALFPRAHPAHPSTMQTRHGHERFVSDRCRMYHVGVQWSPWGVFFHRWNTETHRAAWPACTYSRHQCREGLWTARKTCASHAVYRHVRSIFFFFFFLVFFLESYGVRVCGITSPCHCGKAGGM